MKDPTDDSSRHPTLAGSESSSYSNFFLEMSPGLRLGERYVVTRFLGQGAMGVVVAARDEDLGTHIAAKVLRPSLASSPEAQNRFRREVRIAQRITHANVCRIYDLGRHYDRKSGLDLPFFTMELLQGLTLARYLDEEGPLALDEAYDLLQGIIAGLAAAHHAGIVHRDLKSSNVMIVTDDARRPVITDFGLSFSVARGSRSPITHQGQVLGTPAFIAPEQLRGQAVTAAADIYSLGVLMYQMVTGVLPFHLENPLATAMMRLQQAPPPPSDHLPGLDRRWEQVILHCLRLEPDERPHSVLDVLKAIDPAGPPVLAEVTRAPTPRWFVGLVLLLATTVLAGIAWVVIRPGDGRTAVSSSHSLTEASAGIERPPFSKHRPVLAIMTLTPLAARGEFEWIGEAIAEMLSTEAAALATMRVIPRQEVGRVEQSLFPADPKVPPWADQAERMGSNLGARYLVQGTYLVEENDRTVPQLRVDLHLYDTLEAREAASWSETGTANRLIPLVQRLGASLRERLGGDELDTATTTQLTALHPRDNSVARLLTLGLAELRQQDFVAAQGTLQAAVDLEPAHPRLHAELSRAWKELGYDRRAQDEADRAADLAQGLPREVQLQIQARSQAYRGEWQSAAATWDALVRFYPDEEEYAVQRTRAWIEAGMGHRADTSFEDFAKQFDLAADPRGPLLEASVANLLADLPRAYQAALDAIASAERRVEILLEAAGRLGAANAARRLGRPEEAQRHLDRAATVYRQAGDAYGLANTTFEEARLAIATGDLPRAEQLTMEARTSFEAIGSQRGRVNTTNALASLERRQGRHDRARPEYESALQLAQSIGFDGGTYDSLKGLAILDSMEGDLDAAQKRFEEALEAAEASGNLGDEGAALNNLAIVLSDRGEVDAAETYYQRALARFEQIGHLDGIGSALNNLAILQWDRGDLAAATASYKRGQETYESLGDASSLAMVEANLAMLELDRDDLAEAARGLDHAIALQTELGETLAAAKSRALRAMIQLEAGDAPGALGAAHESLSQLQDQGVPDDEATAQTVLALIYSATGDHSAARREIGKAEQLADRRENPVIGLWIEIQAARIQIAAGDPSSTIAKLQRLVEDTRTAGIRRLELEARLTLAQVEGEMGERMGERTSERSEDLEGLRSEAESLGFKRIVRQIVRPE